LNLSSTSPAADTADRRLVLVTGSGRSGTSTVAGALKMLGLAVPQPEVQADSTNPRGFFEPRWVVDFHREWLKRAGVRTLDARPEAAELTDAVALRPRPRRRLTTWLDAQFTGPQVVVKDPRTFWFRQLWFDAADAVGAEVSFLTMLRHPAEVIGSRDTHYLSKLTVEERRARETSIAAGWLNVAPTTELASRNRRRVFVEYPALIDAWRPVMAEVGARLDLTFNADLATSDPHPVDDFIDGDLRRIRLGWDDLDVPRHLQELADQTWQGLVALSRDPADQSSQQSLDEARDAYRIMHGHAEALVHHATASAVWKARQEARRAVRAELAEHAPRAAAAPPPVGKLGDRVIGRLRAMRRRGPSGPRR